MVITIDNCFKFCQVSWVNSTTNTIETQVKRVRMIGTEEGYGRNCREETEGRKRNGTMVQLKACGCRLIFKNKMVSWSMEIISETLLLISTKIYTVTNCLNIAGLPLQI